MKQVVSINIQSLKSVMSLCWKFSFIVCEERRTRRCGIPGGFAVSCDEGVKFDDGEECGFNRFSLQWQVVSAAVHVGRDRKQPLAGQQCSPRPLRTHQGKWQKCKIYEGHLDLPCNASHLNLCHVTVPTILPLQSYASCCVADYCVVVWLKCVITFTILKSVRCRVFPLFLHLEKSSPSLCWFFNKYYLKTILLLKKSSLILKLINKGT